MRELRVTFNVATSYVTPFQADTIFGHLCWAMKYLDGEEQLSGFLSLYSDDYAPLLVSDGFPADLDDGTYYMPMPDFPRTAVAGQAQTPIDKETVAAIKKAKKVSYIPESELMKNIDPFNANVLNQYCLDRAKSSRHSVDENIKEKQSSVTHNVLDRLTNKSVNLYVIDEKYPQKGFHFLIRIDESVISIDSVVEYMNYIAISGYGSDSSIGKGALKNVKVTDSEVQHIPNADWFINLSSAYVPKPGQLNEGFYTTHVKRGKVGADYVHEVKSVWKRPVLMIKAGAILKGNSAGLYGRLVKNVHYEKPEIVQYGYAYPLGVNVNAADF